MARRRLLLLMRYRSWTTNHSPSHHLSVALGPGVASERLGGKGGFTPSGHPLRPPRHMLAPRGYNTSPTHDTVASVNVRTSTRRHCPRSGIRSTGPSRRHNPPPVAVAVVGVTLLPPHSPLLLAIMAASTESGQPLARIAIDRGGTFTDAICSRKGHEDIVLKVGTPPSSPTFLAAC